MSDRWVAVLSGGLSHEREVSLRSGRRIAAVLRTAGLTVDEWDVDADLLSRLRQHRPDAMIVALHGGDGESGDTQSVLDMLGVPYVGADPHACRRAWDKPSAKAELAGGGLSTPDWVVLPQGVFRELGAQEVLDAMVERLGLPLMVKPDRGGSALGARLVHDAAELPAAVVGCLAYGDGVLAERCVSGVEVAVTVIDGLDGADGPVALPAVEIVPHRGVYDYAARYTAGLTTFHVPARLDVASTAAVSEAAVRAHRLLGLRDISRTDAIVDANGAVQVLEVNTSPGLTETSLSPMAVDATGHSLAEIFIGLIERAIARSHPDS